eukprot:scaffold701_cov158-Amphora_coffeaeformis.AAC.9
MLALVEDSIAPEEPPSAPVSKRFAAFSKSPPHMRKADAARSGLNPIAVRILCASSLMFIMTRDKTRALRYCNVRKLQHTTVASDEVDDLHSVTFWPTHRIILYV